ncbi:hypothetical protein P879_11194 [Paragonimus westermani]|uniref:Uncharacterized protein n=1 Tax=Paragonimus westermani TaxID=34504 RepID=A0A8T0DHR9_9TREM|nr:hypothetical protein P879_11194 [Paragonimus westermani]
MFATPIAHQTLMQKIQRVRRQRFLESGFLELIFTVYSQGPVYRLWNFCSTYLPSATDRQTMYIFSKNV